MAEWLKTITEKLKKPSEEITLRDRLEAEQRRQREASLRTASGLTRAEEEEVNREDMKALATLLAWKLDVRKDNLVANPAKVDGLWLGVSRYLPRAEGETANTGVSWKLFLFRPCPHCKHLIQNIPLGDLAEVTYAMEQTHPRSGRPGQQKHRAPRRPSRRHRSPQTRPVLPPVLPPVPQTDPRRDTVSLKTAALVTLCCCVFVTAAHGQSNNPPSVEARQATLNSTVAALPVDLQNSAKSLAVLQKWKVGHTGQNANEDEKQFVKYLAYAGGQLRQSQVNSLAPLEGELFEAKLLLIAWDMRWNAERYKQIEREYLYAEDNPLARAAQSPALKADRATEEHRLVWEHILLRPPYGIFRPLCGSCRGNVSENTPSCQSVNSGRVF